MQEASAIEIRPVFEADDFGAESTPEPPTQEDRLRTAAPTGKHGRGRRKSNARG